MEVEEIVGFVLVEELVEMNVEFQEVEFVKELVKFKEMCVFGEDFIQGVDFSFDEKVLLKFVEGVVSEVEMLLLQERMKVQGSLLKKFFISIGLKKFFGKKQKGKRGGGDEELGEYIVLVDFLDSYEE